ncbi:IclR family transcriptional regulator [Sciscionella sediminilitoris]|uniref:IclR family transcriptional regulator n=1 Tax=Sciscionella sediminilitoris TaxID=1445613 RepID=UPI0004DECDE9
MPVITDPPPRNAIARTIGLLELLDASHRALTLTEIAQSTGLAKSTAHRLLGELIACATVKRMGDYYTIDWSRLTENHSNELLLRRLIKPVLLELYTATRELVSLGVAHGLLVHYLDTFFDQHQLAVVAQTEERAFMHCTAAGKALLAHDPLLAKRFIRHAPMIACTPQTITSPVTLEAELAVVRRRGLAKCRNEYVPDTIALAVPLFARDGHVIAALGLGGDTQRFNEKAMAAKLLRAAATAQRLVRKSLIGPPVESLVPRPRAGS